MVERLKAGTLMLNQEPSRPVTTTNHGISNLLVEPTTCRCGAPTQDGSRSSSIQENNSSIPRTTRSLKLLVRRILKVKQLAFMETIVVSIKDGLSDILTKLTKNQPRERMMNLDSKSTDLSTSDQDFQ